MLKRLFIPLALAALLIGGMNAQEKTIKLFPAGAPGEKAPLVEKHDTTGSKVGGESVLRISNVSTPTITIYDAPEESATGAAVIVCPGGAYNILAYDLEGTEICEWLNDLGITAVLLKYRVPRREGLEKHTAPLQDLQRAISYVRAHSDDLNIDPDRIGVMGFSAGAHLCAMASNSYQTHTYPKVDQCDTASCRPSFCVLVYPAYLSGDNFQLAPELKVSAQTPQTMLIQAEGDKNFINSSLFYFYALKQVGVPAWMHIYHGGVHGYGLRDTGDNVNEWPDRVEDWFRVIGVLDALSDDSND